MRILSDITEEDKNDGKITQSILNSMRVIPAYILHVNANNNIDVNVIQGTEGLQGILKGYPMVRFKDNRSLESADDFRDLGKLLKEAGYWKGEDGLGIITDGDNIQAIHFGAMDGQLFMQLAEKGVIAKKYKKLFERLLSTSGLTVDKVKSLAFGVVADGRVVGSAASGVSTLTAFTDKRTKFGKKGPKRTESVRFWKAAYAGSMTLTADVKVVNFAAEDQDLFHGLLTGRKDMNEELEKMMNDAN